MGIFRTNDPTQFDDIDGIIIDEQTPPSQITGVAANIAILAGQFQRGPESLSLPLSSIGEFLEVYGKDSSLGSIQLRNKRFGALRILRVTASDAAKASLTLDAKLKLDAKYKGAYGNNLKVTVENASGDVTAVTAVAASFSGAITGVTGSVELSADNVGVLGNSIVLVGDGVKSLTTLVSDWNTANPTNTVTLDSLNGADIPDSGQTMQLSGGVNGVTAVDSGVKLTIKDTNANTVLGTEVYDNLKVSEIVAATFASSKLVDATVLSSTSEIALSAEASLTGGSNGTVADTDYEAALVKAEVEQAGNVLFLDSYNTVRNGYLRTHAALTQDKMVICCGDENDDKDVAITKASALKDADGRVIFAWPWIETTIDGALQYTNPASWVASIFTQVAPHIALSKSQNTQFLAGITSLKYETGRNGHIALDQAGVLAFERDSNIGFIIKNAVVTQTANTQKKEILRRRMTDFLTNSIALALKNWQNDVNSKEKQDEIKAAILDFDTRLVQSKVLPGQQDVKSGSPLLVDTESLNTDSVIALGMFKILYKRRIFSSMRYIVLQAEIGTNIVVTEQ